MNVQANNKTKAGYLLPIPLVTQVKIEAAQQGLPPAKIVEAACKRYLKLRSRKHAASA